MPDSSAGKCGIYWDLRGQLYRMFPARLLALNLHLHIVTKPGVLFGPMQSPFQFGHLRLLDGRNIGAKAGMPRLRLMVVVGRLPAVRTPGTRSNRFSSRIRRTYAPLQFSGWAAD
jgi:hypothetical protein